MFPYEVIWRTRLDCPSHICSWVLGLCQQSALHAIS